MKSSDVSKRLASLFLALWSCTVGLQAQISLTVLPAPGGGTADYTSDFPFGQAVLRATSAGAPLALTPDNVTIIEQNRAVRPFSVLTQRDGSSLVRWSTVVTESGPVVVTVHDELGSAFSPLTPSRTHFPRTALVDAIGRRELLTSTYDFGTVAPGTSDTAFLMVDLQRGRFTGAVEERIKIDSIVTRSPNTRIVWLGNIIEQMPPPNSYTPGFQARFDVVFTPTNSQPFRDTLTVYYEGGIKQSVILFANRTPFQRVKILNILTPNGGERFAPCQEVPITFTGSLRKFQTYIEYSVDDGRTWRFVDSTLDTTYLWRVPADITDNARIRIFQRYDATNQVRPQGVNAPALSSDFNHDGSRLAITYADGSIVVFDAETLDQVRVHRTEPRTFASNVQFIGTTDSLLAIVRRQGGAESIGLFGPSSPTALVSASAPLGYLVDDFGITPDGTMLYLWSVLDSRILEAPIATLQTTVFAIAPGPITAGRVDGTDLFTATVNGVVARYRLGQKQPISTFVFDTRLHDGPVIRSLAVGPSRRFLALAAQADGESAIPRSQATYVMDLQTGDLVDIFNLRGDQNVTGMGFTQSEANLIFGSTDGTAIRAYDLTKLSLIQLPGAGHRQAVTDLDIAPDGSTFVSVSLDPSSSSNAIMRSVATPEADTSNAVFSIVRPIVEATAVTFRPHLVGTRLDTTLTASLCNTGSVPWIIDNARLQGGGWLGIVGSVVGDTVLPGECLTIRLAGNVPRDGIIADTLLVSACGVDSRLPLQMNGIDRNLELVANNTSFGDVCLGTEQRRTLAAIRNRDTVPVTINYVGVEGGLGSSFSVVTRVDNVVIPAGGTLDLDVIYAPKRLGPDSARIEFVYEGLPSLRKFWTVRGRGTGVEITSSVQALPFLPEIPERDVVLRNGTDFPADVVAADITAGAPITVLTTLPLTIPARDSVTIRVRHDGGPFANGATLTLRYAPCGINTVLPLSIYSGSSTLTAGRVVGDVKDDVGVTSIPITTTVREDVPYNGVRTLEAALVLNPRLFLAREVTSTMGTAELLSQDVVRGLRVIRFRVTGRFTEGVVANVVGWSGLAEVDVTSIGFDPAQLNYGTTVTMQFVDGELAVTSPDPDRRILDQSIVTALHVAPNPVDDGVARISLTSLKATHGSMRIVDPQGLDAVAQRPVSIPAGSSTMEVDVRTLRPGAYLVVVTVNGTTTSTKIIVL